MISARPVFRGWLLATLALLAPCGALAVTIPSTISGVFEVPAGEIGELSGTVTFAGGVLDVDGQLRRQANNALLTGDGQVLLNAPSASWTNVCCTLSQMVIDTGVEVLGQHGASIVPSYITNRGTIAAVAGGTTAGQFTLDADSTFINQGVLEARAGAVLHINSLRENNLTATSILRAQAGGTLRLLAVGGHFDQLGDFRTIENLGGNIELRRVDLQNTGQTTTFTGGDWTLLSGSGIWGGAVTSANGGRLAVGQFSTATEPVDFVSTTLATDVFIRTGGRLQPQNVTLDGAALRFTGTVGYLVLPAAGALQGVGSIVAEGGINTSAALQASGGVVTIPDTIALRAPTGTLSLTYASGDTTSTFDIAGPLEASGGTIAHQRALTTRGDVHIHSSGTLDINQTWTNLGTLRIENGGRLDLGGNLVNEGSLEIRHGVILHRGNSVYGAGSISGAGGVTIADSHVLAAGTNTLAQLLAIPGERVDHGTAEGAVNLAGQALEIGSQPGQRWVFSGGTLQDGKVNSLDGTELVPVDMFGKARLTLSNIELNADARIPTGAELTLQNSITGSGNLIVDGGRLTLGTSGTASTPSELLSRITPLGGVVALSGGINNVGATITLTNGVSWRLSHGRNNGIVGGRIEAEPGAALHVDVGYGSGNYATFRQNVTLAAPLVITNTYSNTAYVREGLTLDQATITIGSPITTTPSTARLNFQEPQTLAGMGEVRFMPAANILGDPGLPRVNMIQVSTTAAGTFGLTIEPGILIRSWEGDGYLGGDYQYQLPPRAVAIANYGTMLAEHGHTLSLFVSEFQQRGTLRAEASSTLVVNSQPADPLAPLVNEGRLEAAGGSLHIAGHLALAAASTTHFDLLAAGNAAPLIVTGAVALGGMLEVTLDPAATLAVGDLFPLLSAAGGISGAFERRRLPRLASGLYWRLESDTNTAWLAVLAGAPEGDFNSDGIVDAADYTVWRDVDGTAAGYNIWLAHFGEAAPPGAMGAAATVPEPATLGLLLVALSAMLPRMQRLANQRRRAGAEARTTRSAGKSCRTIRNPAPALAGG